MSRILEKFGFVPTSTPELDGAYEMMETAQNIAGKEGSRLKKMAANSDVIFTIGTTVAVGAGVEWVREEGVVDGDLQGAFAFARQSDSIFNTISWMSSSHQGRESIAALGGGGFVFLAVLTPTVLFLIARSKIVSKGWDKKVTGIFKS
jgi:hypothetical protein